MKRVIVVSDSHGDLAALREAFEMAKRAGRIDIAVFLGDGMREFDQLRPELMAERITCYAVPGNNDWSSHEPFEITFMVGRVRFFACHGHTRHVKYGLERLYYTASEREAQVALYGHTHRAKVDLDYGVQMINPGAVCERFRNSIAYAEICVEDNGTVLPRLIQWP